MDFLRFLGAIARRRSREKKPAEPMLRRPWRGFPPARLEAEAEAKRRRAIVGRRRVVIYRRRDVVIWPVIRTVVITTVPVVVTTPVVVAMPVVVAPTVVVGARGRRRCAQKADGHSGHGSGRQQAFGPGSLGRGHCFPPWPMTGAVATHEL